MITIMKSDPFEAIAAGLVEELNRLGLSAQAYPPQDPITYWFIRCGHCCISLYNNHLWFIVFGTPIQSRFQYEDPDMVEQLMNLIKQNFEFARDQVRPV